MSGIDYQLYVDNLADFIELRFGVYLDTLMGFRHNLELFKDRQQKAAQSTKLSIEEIDKAHLIRSNLPPSSDLKECREREIHCMTQADFKKNNSPGGENYNFAIENCLSDIFNYWNVIKEKLGFLEGNDIDIFPITAYMRRLRNRAQHDLYPERMVAPDKDPIIPGKTITSYNFPSFEIGQPILLSKGDIEALIFEVRAQLATHLVPYINNFLKNQVPTAP